VYRIADDGQRSDSDSICQVILVVRPPIGRGRSIDPGLSGGVS